MTQLLFDRKLLAQNQLRFGDKFHQHNFLHHQIAQVIVENVVACEKNFESALEISSKDEFLQKSLLETGRIKGVFESKITKDCDVSCDDEELSFKDQAFDLIVSNLNLQHVNKVEKFLIDVKNILQKDGVFVMSFFGENNLFDLKKAVFEAENEVLNQVSPRVIPLIDVKMAANLLQKAGFKDVVSSLEVVEVVYENPLNFLRDLKFMGQGNILLKRDKKFMTKKFLDAILNNYAKIAGFENGVKAVFEVVLVVAKKS